VSTDLRLSVAIDLRDIVQLWQALPDEAPYRSGSEIPGGEAVMLLGPVANVEAWQHRYEAVEASACKADKPFETTYGGLDYAGDQVAELHPLLVLATWEDAIRDERGQPTDLRATVERAADYILKSVEWMLGTNEYGDQNFLGIDQLAIELKKVKAMLENILKDGIRADFTRVTCTQEKCETKPRLMKTYGAQARWDGYRCPACKAEYDEDEFKKARAKNFRDSGTEKFISADLAKDVIRADRRTFWSWMQRNKTRAVCDIKTHQVMVWWPAVHDLDEDLRQRRAEARVKRLRASA
jgi:hypothetical protein